MAANTPLAPSNNSEGRPAPNSIRNTLYDVGIFFDNDERHIIEVDTLCKYVITVKIPESPKLFPVKKIDNIEKYFQLLSAKLRTIQNPSVRDKVRAQANLSRAFTYYLTLPDFSDNMYIESVYKWAKHADTVWDIHSGITDEHISLLNTWITDTADISNRVAIFDWDRTLTQFEGFISYNSLINWIKWKQSIIGDNFVRILSKFHEDTLVFLLGGLDRLEKIRTMFRGLQEKGIAICILTNNGACGTTLDNPIYLLLSQLIGNSDFTLLCSRPAPFRGNKGLTLQQNPKFAKLCTRKSEGGRRRLKRQKRKSQKRKRS
jgi:hypothetical protein